MTSPLQTRTIVALAAAILALFIVAVVCQTRIEKIRAEVRPQEALYISSPAALKRLSLGYTGLVADIYWTRAVQYFGWKHKHREVDYHLLYPMLDITTQLDPQLVVAYRFGATFLAEQPPNGAGQPEKAAELIERGIKANPDDWHLYYDLGFLQAMERRDYIAAADAFNRGSKVRNTHPFLKILAASMAQHGGDVGTARMLWQTTYDTTEDPMIKQNAAKHLRALQVDDTIQGLENVIQTYRQRTGVYPQGFLELVSAGYLRAIPTDPLGHPYKLLPNGRIQVQDPDSLPFIKRGLPPGYESQTEGVPRNKM